MDNGTFVDNILDQIRTLGKHPDWTQQVLDHLKGYYTNETVKVNPQAQLLIEKIDLRVKEMFDVIDPMWFVVALYHRNKGGLWRDMHKYGVKKEYASSYKTEKASSTNRSVYTPIMEGDDVSTL